MQYNERMNANNENNVIHLIHECNVMNAKSCFEFSAINAML